MPQNIAIGVLVLGGILVLIAILGGNFKLFGAEVAATVSNPFLRFVAFLFGTVLIIMALQQPSPSEKSKKGQPLRVWANSVEGTALPNKTGGYAQVSFEAHGTWLAIPEDNPDAQIPKSAKGYISPNGDPNFESNKTPCRAPLGALIIRGEDRQCKAAYGSKGSFELRPGETVYFLMNDVPELYKDNNGYIDIDWSISKE